LLALAAEALLNEICRNRRFLKEWLIWWSPDTR